MLERLFEFLSQFGKHLLPFVVVPVYQNVGILRLGKYHRTRGPGLHWKWPFIEDPYHENIFLTTVRLQPQTLTTKDDESIVVAGVVALSGRRGGALSLPDRGPARSAHRHEHGATSRTPARCALRRR